jgi:hypothetical protein
MRPFSYTSSVKAAKSTILFEIHLTLVSVTMGIILLAYEHLLELEKSNINFSKIPASE